MQKKTSTELLSYMIPMLIEYLEELSATSSKNEEFICGERTAYTECLELLQMWEHAEAFGLDFNVEKRFPL